MYQMWIFEWMKGFPSNKETLAVELMIKYQKGIKIRNALVV